MSSDDFPCGKGRPVDQCRVGDAGVYETRRIVDHAEGGRATWGRWVGIRKLGQV